MKTIRRLIFAALAFAATLPGCYEIDGIWPWNWHAPRFNKHEQLKGKQAVEEKKQTEGQPEAPKEAPKPDAPKQ
jgi:hypothetical protein